MRAALRAAGDWDDTRTTRTQVERTAATRFMQFTSPVARLISDRHLRHLCRDFLLAGWSARELLYALDHKPDGSQHPYTYNAADLRVPAGWIAHRLRFWRTTGGSPLPGYRQAKQQAAAVRRTRTSPTGPRPTTASPASVSDAGRGNLARDRALLAQVRADRIARETADRDRRLQAETASASTPPAQDRSATIRARALARARIERLCDAGRLPSMNRTE